MTLSACRFLPAFHDRPPPPTRKFGRLHAAGGLFLRPSLLTNIGICNDLSRDDVLRLAAGERQRMGDLLYSAGRLTRDEVHDLLKEQQHTGKKLGDLLVERRVLSAAERDIVLDFQRHQEQRRSVGRLRLGEILVRTGQITRTQLDDALQRQAASGRRLGAELVSAGHLCEGQIRGGLLLQSKLIGYALTLALAFATTGIAPAARAEQSRSSSLKLQVMARVAAFFRLQVQYQAAGLTVAQDDIERGYVDVPAASRFSIATNTRDGYVVDFFPVANIFRAVTVQGLGTPLELTGDGGSVTLAQGAGAPPGRAHELGYRFMLRSGMQPGTYPWPLTLSVHPM